eukprot:767963-Hanusia_phi.AAC.6
MVPRTFGAVEVKVKAGLEASLRRVESVRGEECGSCRGQQHGKRRSNENRPTKSESGNGGDCRMVNVARRRRGEVKERPRDRKGRNESEYDERERE